MSSVATPLAGRRNDPYSLAPMARALAWEECRVGGAVAVLCGLLGAAIIVLLRAQLSVTAWEQQDGFLLTVVLGTPLLTALLLVLSPANSGHLMGGFSKRILWLPVPVPLAVGVTLPMRALFVFAAAALVVAVTGVLFEGGPPLTMALGFVALYLFVQTIDWARAVISGLTSLLILAALVVGVFVLSQPVAVLESVRTAAESAGFMGGLLLVAVLGTTSYGASVMLVNATRRGRRFGVPEVWEWSSAAARSGATPLRPFQTAVGAQVWFELRSYGWTMPAVTLLLPALLLGPAMAFNSSDTNTVEFMALALYGFFLLGALAHGVRARVLGIRSSAGKPGFALLQPMPAERVALAKALAALAVMLPTLLIMMAIQIAVLAPAYVTDVIPYAWANGMTNAREVVWALGSRAVLLALAAWLLMAVGTRAVRTLAVAAPVCFLLLVWLETRLPDKTNPEPSEILMMLELMGGESYEQIYILPIHVYFEVGSFWFMLMLFAGTSIFVTMRAWKRGLISRRAVAAWGTAFLLTAWIIATALPETLPYGPRTALDYLNETMICLAWASIVPLPYMATVLDASRRRHGASPRQDVVKPLPPALPRSFAWGMAVPAVLLIAWLTWPATPASQKYLQAISSPVQGDENISQKYLGLIERKRELNAALTDRWRESSEHSWGDVYLDGHTNWPLSDHERAATERYWETVVAPLMPEMKELAAKFETSRSGGYGLTFSDDSSVFSGLRGLARDAAIDVFYWSQRGNSRHTADGVIAVFGVANSLVDDPSHLNLLTAKAIMSIGTGGLETSLGEVPFDDADLARVQAYLAASIRWDLEEQIQRIRHWELMDTVPVVRQTTFHHATSISNSPEGTPGWLLVNPITALAPFGLSPAAESMAALVLEDHIMRIPEGQHFLADRFEVRNEIADSIGKDSSFLASTAVDLATISFSPYIPVSVGEARVYIDTARAGIAAERYRLAHGEWPESLDALVPAYLDSVPIDHFAREEGATLRHTVRDDGTFVIYSVGPSGEDHGGLARWETKERNTDDLTFVVGRGRE